jgi:diaminopimelate epimerase
MIVWKGVALGNDYVVMNADELPWPMTPARCAALCDRHTGVGSDGILIADMRGGCALRILNPDGSEAEKSGNGLRIFAAWLYALGFVRNDWFTVRLVRDSVRMRVEVERPDGEVDVRVEMGRASFIGRDVGLPASHEFVDQRLELGDGLDAVVTAVSVANPHCVVFPPRLDRDDFLQRAPRLCTLPAFAAGTNVQFARVVGPDALEIWIWERGVGETLASGSSACAAAAAAVRRGALPPGRVEVRMRGGSADVEVSEAWAIRLHGPARIVFRAEIAAGQLAAWGRPD